MKKLPLLIPVFFLAVSHLFAQSPGSHNELSAADAAITRLVSELHNTLVAEKAQKVTLSDFVYEDRVTPMGRYWENQLGEGLANRNGPYSVLSGSIMESDLFVSGEIVDLTDTIRVYSRLIRSSDRAIRAVFHTDIERSEYWVQMLSSGGGRRSSNVPRDAWEPDSWDQPVPYEIGADPSAPYMNRTLHSGDEDFFLILPGDSGRLVMETTGDTDTYMELYNAETRENLAQDDDSGSGVNARIRYNIEAGKRYIVKVRGYDSDCTGYYGFRAFYPGPSAVQSDEYEPDDCSELAKPISIGTPQIHTFHDSDDEDWVKFEVSQRGRYTIRARGANTNYLDTYIELYDSDLELIDEDDDGGESLDSRLVKNLNPGLYYLRVTCLDDDPDQPYIINVDRE